ncbi:MAG TPA: hypothetical protein PKZ53_11240 [Acidobacteriota bacterium]|nr:hypothetical protein [Acidobacteriota bacterium]
MSKRPAEAFPVKVEIQGMRAGVWEAVAHISAAGGGRQTVPGRTQDTGRPP